MKRVEGKNLQQLNAPWSLALLAFAGTLAGGYLFLQYRAQHRLARMRGWTGKRLPRGRWGAAVTAVSGGHPEDLNGSPHGWVSPSPEPLSAVGNA